jgi:hypothetical protein
MAKNIKVTGVPRGEVDGEQLALIYWLQAKRILRERRQQEAKARQAKRARGAQGDGGEVPR